MGFKNISDLYNVIIEKWRDLDKVSDYLNDAGNAKKEALQCLIWHLAFYDDLKEFMESPTLTELSEIEGKHQEYYKTLRMISNAITRKINEN